MAKRIAIIVGHPDPAPTRLARVLAEAYRQGAEAAGHEVRVIDVAQLDFPMLRSQQEFESAPQADDILRAQADIGWAEHLALFYPLWFGDAPAYVKGFLEQTFRPGFAIRYRPSGLPEGLLKGKSARIVVTMNMPAWVYRFFFLAHGLRNLKRNLLAYAGVAPIRVTMVGSAKTVDRANPERWRGQMLRYGGAGD